MSSKSEHNTPASATLVDWARALEWESLDADTIHHAKRHLIDTIGAMLIGSLQQVTQSTDDALQSVQPSGSIPVLGRSSRWGLLDAVYLSGVMAHGTETDDGYRQGSLHPGAVVVPAIVPLAMREHSHGRQFLTALTVGYQAIGSVSAAAHPALRRHGFHPTSVVGPLGAALACSVLQGQTREQALHALGIAASSAGGLFAFKGGGADVKRLHAGHAAREGVLASVFAGQGLEGPRDVLEASDGFMQAYAGVAPGMPFTLDLPPIGVPTITDCYIKPYACCRHIQPAVDALQSLLREHQVGIEEINAIEVETYSIAREHAHVPWGTFAEAQLSFPYVLATAAQHGDLRIARFDANARASEVTARLAGRISVTASAAMDARYPHERPAEVRLITARGQWTCDVSEALGAPEMPVSDAQIDDKFLDLAGAAIGAVRARCALDELWRIDEGGDVGTLFATLCGAGH